jgi:transposase
MDKKSTYAKGQAPHRYDAAFKESAAKLVTEQGRTTREVADELGISADSLRAWFKAAGVSLGDANRSNKDAKCIRELEAQVKALKKQTAEKDEVINVLKKSMGSYPQDSGRPKAVFAKQTY